MLVGLGTDTSVFSGVPEKRSGPQEMLIVVGVDTVDNLMPKTESSPTEPIPLLFRSCYLLLPSSYYLCAQPYQCLFFSLS